MSDDNVRKVELLWTSGQVFRAETPSGSSITLDGDVIEGFSPMESLLASVGACMGIDVVHILTKMHIELQGLAVSTEGERAIDPPRYFQRVRMRFRFSGPVPKDKAEHAVELSLAKYCSVFHSMRRDIEVETAIELE
jgi:putative redox protein